MFLDSKDSTSLEYKLDSFSSVYRRLTGKDVRPRDSCAPLTARRCTLSSRRSQRPKFERGRWSMYASEGGRVGHHGAPSRKVNLKQLRFSKSSSRAVRLCVSQLQRVRAKMRERRSRPGKLEIRSWIRR